MTSVIKGIVFVVALGICVAGGTAGLQMQATNAELKNQIAQRDSLIQRYQTSELLTCQSTGRYDSLTTRYITTDCSLLVDGKKISLEKFIDIYLNQVAERAEAESALGDLRRTLDALEKVIRARDQECATAQDSLTFYKSIVRTVKKNYGLKTRTRVDGKYRITDYETPRLDSALMLLDVYRDRLRYDSLSRKWIISRESIPRTVPGKKR